MEERDSPLVIKWRNEKHRIMRAARSLRDVKGKQEHIDYMVARARTINHAMCLAKFGKAFRFHGENG